MVDILFGEMMAGLSLIAYMDCVFGVLVPLRVNYLIQNSS
jgi:hypothetical protein